MTHDRAAPRLLNMDCREGADQTPPPPPPPPTYGPGLFEGLRVAGKEGSPC